MVEGGDTRREGRVFAWAEELEGICRSLAHDLRSPLRAIHGNAAMLEESLGSAVGPEDRESFQSIQENARRIGALVEGAAAYARLSSRSPGFESVDVSHLARSLAAGKLTLVAEQDVTICADPDLTTQLLECLLSNAAKFVDGSHRATVELGSSSNGFFIRDNGIGFDMRWHDQIFLPFQRLHRDEYPGAGMGLAIARRIALLHGGRVWAESEPGRGATFFVSLGEQADGSNPG